MQKEIENRLIKELNNSSIKFNINFIDYVKDNKTLFSYNPKRNMFYISNDIWNNIKSIYNIDNENLSQLTSMLIEKILGYNDVTATNSHFITDTN